MAINLMYIELNRLVEDYYKCSIWLVKEYILNDIKLLSEALIQIDPRNNGTTFNINETCENELILPNTSG